MIKVSSMSSEILPSSPHPAELCIEDHQRYSIILPSEKVSSSVAKSVAAMRCLHIVCFCCVALSA